MTHKCISFRGNFDAGVELRTETYLGREYLVVPVVALVEGVLQGMNADVPELALSSEFGRAPQGWDGRPVVMNHPVVNGLPVSANSPAILEEYAFGMLFNTRIEDNKLKTEAWLDTVRALELGGDIQSTVERIQNDTVVEVSTGLFTGIEETSGKFNGRKYSAIWRGIIPDHLAFLPEGIIGACSVEDGCGTPRVNNATTARWQEYKMTTSTTPTTPKVNDCGCGCEGNDVKVSAEPEFKNNAGNTLEFSVDRFVANAIPEGLLDSDVRKLLNQALRMSFTPNRYAYIVGFTASVIVYEIWDNITDMYATYQRTYSISETREVTLGDEISQVNILMEIVPVNNTQSRLNTTKEPSTMANGTPITENHAIVTDNAGTAEKEKNKEMKPNASTPSTPSTPVAPRTLEQYLADLPEEMAEVTRAGLRLHEDKKQGLITAIKACGRNKFSDAYLNNLKLEDLQAMSELANIPSYEGTATPRTNAAANDEIPDPPVLFPVRA